MIWMVFTQPLPSVISHLMMLNFNISPFHLLPLFVVGRYAFAFVTKRLEISGHDKRSHRVLIIA